MKKGDKVYVNWPTGKGGPYYVEDGTPKGWVVINFDGRFVPVDPDWWEPAEPEIEPDRLCYYWDGPEDDQKARHFAQRGGDTRLKWDHIEPVHRRWDELKKEEQNIVHAMVVDIQRKRLSIEGFFKYIYKLITGEEHP